MVLMSVLTGGLRWLTLALSLSMAAVLLPGCGSEAPATGPAASETTQPTAAATLTSSLTQPPVEVGHEAGQKAPDFVLTTVDGEQVTLDSLQGQPAVLYFYATW